MTWVHFMTWILVIYGAYYAAIISWDMLIGKRPAQENQTPVLSFAEHVEAMRPELADEPETSDQPVKGTGGVNLKRLYELCRDETVEYRKAVSY